MGLEEDVDRKIAERARARSEAEAEAEAAQRQQDERHGHLVADTRARLHETADVLRRRAIPTQRLFLETRSYDKVPGKREGFLGLRRGSDSWETKVERAVIAEGWHLPSGWKEKSRYPECRCSWEGSVSWFLTTAGELRQVAETDTRVLVDRTPTSAPPALGGALPVAGTGLGCPVVEVTNLEHCRDFYRGNLLLGQLAVFHHSDDVGERGIDEGRSYHAYYSVISLLEDSLITMLSERG